MRKLIALFALLLSTSAAMAQTDKVSGVTKLPGEEKLSVRERAERDFLMPVRRKKLVEASRVTASAESESTAAPELDVTAHYTEAPEARFEEAAAPARLEHTRTVHHRSRAAHVASLRRSTAARHTKTVAHRAKATKAASRRTTKKIVASKAKTKVRKASTKKAVSKTKAKSTKKRR